MATIKSYTDISQAKVLAKILPLESADMLYTWDTDNKTYYPLPIVDDKEHDFPSGLPCWSLSALLNLIPQEIFDGNYIINITEGWNNKWMITYDHHENRNHSYHSLSIGANNLIDACVAMIEKLDELKML